MCLASHTVKTTLFAIRCRALKMTFFSYFQKMIGSSDGHVKYIYKTANSFTYK